MSDFFQTLENEYKDFMSTINNNIGKFPSQNRGWDFFHQTGIIIFRG